MRKKSFILVAASTLLFGLAVSVGEHAGSEGEVKADQNWQEHTVLYANATSYDNLYARVKRGDDVGWESHSMTNTGYKYGSKYVYTGQIWECYGGLNNMYMKSGNAGSDDGNLVQTIFEEWTITDVWSGKMFDGSNWKSVYSVTFDLNGHGSSAPTGQYVDSGAKATQPTAPTDPNYTFGGWYKEAGCTNAWNFASDTVSSNTTLYAKWSGVEYTVTKYKVLGSASPVKISEESVGKGTSYSVPAKIYEAGYVFDDWYTNAACTSKYTGSTINANLDLYAKYTAHGPYSGTIHVDLRDSGWAVDGANYAVYLMDKTTYASEVGGWSSYLTGTSAGQNLVEISYSVSFEPLLMTVVRYNSAYTKSEWEADGWKEAAIWNQTEDIDFGEMVRVGGVESGKEPAWIGYPRVMGNTQDNQNWRELNSLGSVKLNSDNHAEYYSTAITLTAGTQFKIHIAPYANGDYCGSFSTHSSLEGAFSGGGSNDITVVTGGTYAFYFDYSHANKLYITTVDLAVADDWAQYFLANVGCDASGVKEPTGWTACASAYAELSSGAKDIIYGTSGREDGNFVEMAVARYEAALRSHPSLAKFITNGAGNKTKGVSEYALPTSSFDASIPTICIVLALTTYVTFAVLIIVKRKKQSGK